MTNHGSCLCGRVQIEISGEIKAVFHCHCVMCRKAHGAAFATFAVCKSEHFTLIADDATIGRYQSSAETQRTFCTGCGSNLQWNNEGEEKKGWSSFALSLLDTPVEPENQKHTFVASKAPWFTFCDHHPKLSKF